MLINCGVGLPSRERLVPFIAILPISDKTNHEFLVLILTFLCGRTRVPMGLRPLLIILCVTHMC